MNGNEFSNRFITFIFCFRITKRETSGTIILRFSTEAKCRGIGNWSGIEYRNIHLLTCPFKGDRMILEMKFLQNSLCYSLRYALCNNANWAFQIPEYAWYIIENYLPINGSH